MSDREILEKAIQKAIDGGWFEAPSDKSIGKIYVDNFSHDDPQMPKIWAIIISFTDRTGFMFKHAYHFFYKHDFARALWGELPICESCQYPASEVGFDKHDPYCSERTEYMPAWEHHLQQMVIADDPIKYLGENI